MKKVAVLGSGAWGTTLGQVMVDSGQQVLIWGRNKKVVREINRRHSNRRFLKGIDLPKELLSEIEYIHLSAMNPAP